MVCLWRAGDCENGLCSTAESVALLPVAFFGFRSFAGDGAALRNGEPPCGTYGDGVAGDMSAAVEEGVPN